MPDTFTICESCQQATTLWDHHHTFFKRTSNPNVKPYVDDPKNIAKVCRVCHGNGATKGGRANSYHFKLAFWEIQCARYGSAEMKRWYKDVPLKVKEKFWEDK